MKYYDADDHPKPTPDPIKVCIVDDEESVLQALACLVNTLAGCTCVGCFKDGQTALKTIPSLQPHVVLMDLKMPGMDGIECVAKLKNLCPEVEIIILTVYQDTDSILRSLAAGANGYLLKRATKDELYNAIRQVVSGGSPMSSQIARKIVQLFRQPVSVENEASRLSPREQEVLALLARGYLYKEIAQQLNISYHTVHNYIRRIYCKLRVRSRGQAVAKYFEQSLSHPLGLGQIWPNKKDHPHSRNFDTRG